MENVAAHRLASTCVSQQNDFKLPRARFQRWLPVQREFRGVQKSAPDHSRT